MIELDRAVAIAVARNPNLQVAAEEITRAHALVEQVRSASLPTLAGNAFYTRLDGGPVAGGSANIDANLGGLNLSVSIPIVTARSWYAWRHAKQNVDVTRLSAAEIKRELAAAVARTYLAVIAQRRVIEVSQRARVTASAHYEYAHQRFAGGYGNRVDEVRAAEEVATDEAQVESAQAQLTRLRESLGVLLGVDHAVDATAEVTLPQPPAAADAAREAQSQREDLRLYRGRLELAKNIRRDSWSEYLPTLAATLQPFWQSSATLLLPSAGWQAQLVLAWPLYDGGLRYGVIHERDSIAREAQLNLENVERQISADVRAADDEVRRSTVALDSARAAAKLAAEALSLTNLGYQAGASTNIEVIDAERRARDADTAVAQAEDAWRQSQLDLLLAAGRFPGR